ncbi:MAG: Rab family GTPase [Pseudomonadota bacterium]
MAGAPQKILFLGAMAVGKSSLIRRLISGEFDADYKSTLGVKLHELNLNTGQGPQKVMLWDTDGEAGSAILNSPYAIGADAAILVSDVSRPETLNVLFDLADAMEEALPGRPYLGVCNKTDLASVPDSTMAQLSEYCDLTAATSAVTGHGVEDALYRMVSLVAARKRDY